MSAEIEYDLLRMLGALALRRAGHFPGVGEDGLACDRARTWSQRSREHIVVQRQHVVLGRLDQEELLHVAELLRHLRREVVVLRIVLGDVVQLPVVAVDDIRHLAHAHRPRSERRRRRCDPAIMVDRPISHHLEILRRARGRRVRVGFVERVGHAHAFERSLGNAIRPSPAPGCPTAWRIVGAMSIRWWNCVRMPPTSVM